MLYIPRIDDYLKILTGEKEKNFAAINFIEYLNVTKEKLNYELNEYHSLTKVAKSLYIF